ncbi:MAG: lipoprotein [Gammaproteobacteria bacterium]|nr:lipoprotein [Gammaproteobacteria bacterium]
MKKLAAVIFLCLGLMACGQTGALYLPDQETPQQNT